MAMRRRRGPAASDTVRMLGAGHAVRVETGRLADAARRPGASILTPKLPKTASGASGDRTRVLGLDLAMQHTGWCLLVGGRPEAHGTIDLPTYQRRGESLAAFLGRRAEELGRQVGLLIATHRPELVGYEFPDRVRGYHAGGSKGREFHAVQGLSRAEGFLVALWPAIGRGARLMAVPMTEAKRAACGRETASKDQVAWGLVTHRGWNLRGWTPDQVDAAAVALAAREGL